MIKRTRHGHTNYTALLPFVKQADGREGSARFKAPGFMDLTVECLYCRDPYGNPVYSITHWGCQNGDMMRDPDMEFSIDRDGERIIPLSFRNDYMGIHQEILKVINGKQMYSASLVTDLDAFLWQWLKNIRAQGFIPERAETI